MRNTQDDPNQSAQDRSSTAPERIETARLVLRRPIASDAEAIFARYAGDAVVTRYLGWPTHRSVDETRAFLAFSEGEWTRWPAGPYVIESRDGRLLGGAGFSFEAPHRAATGYVLARDAWGHGFATEALAALVTRAPALGLQRLYALCHPEHQASARVLDKCGFACEGRLRRYSEFPNLQPGVPADVLCYSRVAFGVKEEASDVPAEVPEPQSGAFRLQAQVPVHSATPADAAAWLEMRRALWPEHGGSWHAAEIEQYYAGTLRMPLEVLIAKGEGGRALGFAELFIRPYAEGCSTDRVAFLEGWFVVPDARGRGVGRALIAAAEDWGRAQGCTEFGSDAEIDNLESAAAHRALGFEEVDQIRCFRKSLV